MSQLYSELGIIHLFALSGMQVAFFLDAFRRFFLRLGLEQEKVAYLLYPFSLLYAGMTGFSVSVVRSLLQKLLAQAGLKGMENMESLSFITPSFTVLLVDCWRSLILRLRLYIDSNLFRRGEGGNPKSHQESLVLTLGVSSFLIFFFGEYQPGPFL